MDLKCVFKFMLSANVCVCPRIRRSNFIARDWKLLAKKNCYPQDIDNNFSVGFDLRQSACYN